MDAIAELRSQYEKREITLKRYVADSLTILEIREIDLNQLSSCLDVPYSSLRDIIIKLRREGAINIPARRRGRSTRTIL